MPDPNSEANKELSVEQLKDASGGYNAGTNWLKRKASFSELSNISRHSKPKNKASDWDCPDWCK